MDGGQEDTERSEATKVEFRELLGCGSAGWEAPGRRGVKYADPAGSEGLGAGSAGPSAGHRGHGASKRQALSWGHLERGSPQQKGDLVRRRRGEDRPHDTQPIIASVWLKSLKKRSVLNPENYTKDTKMTAKCGKSEHFCKNVLLNL